jgi:hypothetical protein
VDQGRIQACTKEIQIVDLPAGDTAQRHARTDARAISATRFRTGGTG